MAMPSTKWFVFRVVVLSSALFLAILASYVVRGGKVADLFGWGDGLPDQSAALDWCEGEIDYVRINEPPDPNLKTEELSPDEAKDFCSLQITGYQPDAVKEFVPQVLVRYVDGAQEVFEADSEGHFRFRGLIFRSEELSDWLQQR